TVWLKPLRSASDRVEQALPSTSAPARASSSATARSAVSWIRGRPGLPAPSRRTSAPPTPPPPRRPIASDSLIILTHIALPAPELAVTHWRQTAGPCTSHALAPPGHHHRQQSRTTRRRRAS